MILTINFVSDKSKINDYNMFVIKDILKSKGLTVGFLADKLNMRQNNLSAVINGNRNISLTKLKEIAEILEVPFIELFEKPNTSFLSCPNCGAELEIKKK